MKAAPRDVTTPPEAPVDLDEEARAAVHVGLWVCAVRCLLAYVVAPALGAVGALLGPVGLLLQVAGAVTATAGARRLWHLGHALRYPYVALAVVVDAATLAVLGSVLG